MTKIVLQGYILVSNEDLSAVQNELSHHQKLTQAESGCIVFEVEQNDHKLNRFDVYEEFIDQEAFDYHQLRVKQSTWGKITANVQRFYKIRKAHDETLN